MVHVASMNLEKKFKELMHVFVRENYKLYGSERTWDLWKKARSDFSPFAVPEE